MTSKFFGNSKVKSENSGKRNKPVSQRNAKRSTSVRKTGRGK